MTRLWAPSDAPLLRRRACVQQNGLTLQRVGCWAVLKQLPGVNFVDFD